jgi:hypothetical protein
MENKQTLPAGWKFIDDSHRSRGRQIAETLVEERSILKSLSAVYGTGDLLPTRRSRIWLSIKSVVSVGTTRPHSFLVVIRCFFARCWRYTIPAKIS